MNDYSNKLEISNERIDELEVILANNYKINLNRKELHQLASNLVNYFTLLYEVNKKYEQKCKD